MPSTSRVLLAVGLLLLARSPAAAQSDTLAVRAVADSFFQAVAAERFTDAARLMDLEAFDAERRSEVESLRHPMPTRHLTADYFQKLDPTAPRAVAEWQAQRFNAPRRDDAMRLRFEYGVSTIDSLSAMTAEQAAARQLAVHDVRFTMRESISGGIPSACKLDSADRRKALEGVSAMRVVPARIMGVVMDGDVAYVLHTRADIEGLGDMPGPPDAHAGEAQASPAARGWMSIHPPTLEMRFIGGRWRVGPELAPDGGFAMTGCGRAK